MLLTVLENTRTTTDFYIKTLHMYEARIMKELFLADYQRLTYAEQGSVNYNVGRVIYEQKEELDSMCRQSAHLPFYRNFVR